MTDHEVNSKMYLAQGIQEGLKTVDYCNFLLYHYMQSASQITKPYLNTGL